MTPAQAKKIIRAELQQLGPEYAELRLTAQTIGFSDLARANCIFVHIHDYPGNLTGYTLANSGKPSTWEQLAIVAKSNGFRLD